MKLILGLFVFALSAGVMAGNETQTFNYDGSDSTTMMNFKGEKTHTEYRTEQVSTTCWRTVIVGYQTICHAPTGLMDDPRRPHPPGSPGPGYPYPRPPVCYQQPVYQNVPYSCIQTVRTPFEVKDYDVEAKVSIDVKKTSDIASVEKLNVTLEGDVLTISAKGSKKFFVMLTAQKVDGRMNGSVKMIDASYSIQLVEAAPILGTLSMTNIEINKNVLTFGLGPVANRSNLGFALTVVKKKLLASDTVLFDRDLLDSEVVIKPTARGSNVNVNVKDLGVKITSGKYGLTARAFFKAEGTLLNRSQFSNYEASRTLIYTIR